MISTSEDHDSLTGIHIIDAAFFEPKSQRGTGTPSAAMQPYQQADQGYLEDDAQFQELAQQAGSLFRMQAPREQRRLIDFPLSNCSWRDGKLSAEYRKPFDLRASAVIEDQAKGPWMEALERKTSIWLGWEDSNLRMSDPKSDALPLGDTPAPGAPDPPHTAVRSHGVYAPPAPGEPAHHCCNPPVALPGSPSTSRSRPL